MSVSAASAVLPFPSSDEAEAWISICPLAAILPDTGVTALVRGRQIAIVRLRDGRVFALDNRDPFTGAHVLARGLVGDRGGVAKIASPLHKQSFALATGECLDEPGVRVRVHGARVTRGVVEISLRE